MAFPQHLREQTSVLLKKHFVIFFQGTISFVWLPGHRLCRSGRRRKAWRNESAEEQTGTRRQSHSLPRKREWCSASGCCSSILKIRFAFQCGGCCSKSPALQFWLPFPLCSPLSKIIAFYKCQWDMVRGELCFWRSRCQLWQVSMNRHISTHVLQRNKGHSPPYV